MKKFFALLILGLVACSGYNLEDTASVQFTNFAVSTIADVGGITSGATTVNVQAGDGALFPSTSASNYFYCVLVDSSANREVVKVTTRSTDTFTIVRGQDGTTPRAFAEDDKIELRLTKGALEDISTFLEDADADTMVQVEESSDEDKVRIDTGGTERVVIDSTATDVDNLSIGGTLVTSTATELNALDGITATVGELNILDGVTATYSELNSAADGIGVTIPRVAIVNMGDWNMDSTLTISVAHNLTGSKIYGAVAMIRDDSDVNHYTLGEGYASSGNADAWIGKINATTVYLYRETSGDFDGTDFNATSYNRGWIILFYID